MIIIKSTRYLPNYQYLALSVNVREALLDAIQQHRELAAETIVKLFECYCHVTGQSVKLIHLSSDSFINRTTRGFLGALHSSDFVKADSKTRQEHARRFVKALDHIRQNLVPALKELQWTPDLPEQCVEQWKIFKPNIYLDAVEYWSGWGVSSRQENEAYLRISPLYQTHGKKFAIDFHEALKLYAAKHATFNPTRINHMVDYLSNHCDKWPAETFDHPIQLREFFVEYMKHVFISAHEKGLSLPSKAKEWSSLVLLINDCFIEPGRWVLPFEKLPLAKIRGNIGSKTKIVRDENSGASVSEKLITDVPLTVTDDQAIEILFKQISRDLERVKKWAGIQAQLIYSLCQKRKELAKNGSPINGGMHRKSYKEIKFSNMCSTFERDGFVREQDYLRKNFGSRLPQAAKNLGLPTSDSLFPYQILLVIEHPAITTSFLKKLQLFNKNGHLTGFVETDGVYQLIGAKERRGKSRAEQKIILTSESAELVKQVIEITKPIREYLKAEGSDNWRYLFITCGKGFSEPIKANLPKWSPSAFKKIKATTSLKKQFEECTDLSKDSIESFLARVSLDTIRNSRGVEIFIKEGSVEKMADALGHLKYNPSLLTHYLPEPLLAFFQSRWVRIFQKGFICHAMKDSNYLLESTQFESMIELHEFLKNHALKNVPDLMIEPHESRQDVSKNQDDGEVFVRIDAGVLTVLISLERAVEAASEPERVNGTALYWTKFSRLIREQIVSEQDPDLCRYLEKANLHADEAAMEELIYATA